MYRQCSVIVCCLIWLLAGSSCSPEVPTDGDGDSDSDTDVDTDVDSDVDTDVDSDTDVDTDVDGDSDSDTDSDSDADGCVDEDEDGYGVGETCEFGGDCDDTDPDVHPGVEESCNGVDDDCNDEVDDEIEAPSCELTEGVCAGATATCGGTSGWLPCGASEYGDDYEEDETTCDALDNDCNGETDEADCPCLPGDTQPCGTDVGACEQGIQRCTDEGTFGPCEGGVGPMGETCNGEDDDCDGVSDEVSDLTAPDCPLQRGVCAGARRSCEGAAGWGGCSGVASYGGDYEATETSCDGLDNDCDGITDEGCVCVDGDDQPCGSDVGLCVSGSQTCTSGAWGACIGEVLPEDETCNGVDDDCDGSTDEELPAPACLLTLGVCAGSSQPCSGAGGFVACTAADYGSDYEATETSCDGRDNDCDGVTDEGCTCVSGRTQGCGTAVGACELGTQTCVAGEWGPCVGGVTPVPETCNGADDDCDGESDEDLTPPACALGVGVCVDSTAECGGAAGWLACAGTDSYGASYVVDETGGTVEAVCDGLDNDCDGVADEGCTSGPLLTQPEDAILPSLYGNHLVYLSNSGGNWDVFFGDLRTGATRQLTATAEDETEPQVHGHLVVYVRGAEAAARVVLYDLATDTETVLSTAQSGMPRVDGNLVLWEDYRAGNWDVYAYDVATATEIPFVTTTANEGNPDIRSAYAVYVSDATGTWVTHLVDLVSGTDTAITASPAGDQFVPRVDFATIGWIDGRSVTPPGDSFSDWQIYGALISAPATAASVVTAAGSQLLRDLDGTYYVWSDYRAGNWDVGIAPWGGAETLLTSSVASQADPTISGNLVVWEDNRLGSYDLYASTFGVVTAAAGQVTINEVLADPPAAGDPNGDGTSSTTQDEFVELTNVTAVPLDISGFTLSDSVSVRHTFAAGTVLQAGGAIVVFAGGRPTGLFGAASVPVAFTGSLGLNNDGDTVTLRTPAGVVVDTMTYHAEGGHDTSLVRVPEYTGAFVEHFSDPLSGGRRYSPGTIRTGYAF